VSGSVDECGDRKRAGSASENRATTGRMILEEMRSGACGKISNLAAVRRAARVHPRRRTRRGTKGWRDAGYRIEAAPEA